MTYVIVPLVVCCSSGSRLVIHQENRACCMPDTVPGAGLLQRDLVSVLAFRSLLHNGEKPIFTVLCVHTVMEVCAGSGIASADQGESSSWGKGSLVRSRWRKKKKQRRLLCGREIHQNDKVAKAIQRRPNSLCKSLRCSVLRECGKLGGWSGERSLGSAVNTKLGSLGFIP